LSQIVICQIKLWFEQRTAGHEAMKYMEVFYIMAEFLQKEVGKLKRELEQKNSQLERRTNTSKHLKLH